MDIIIVSTENVRQEAYWEKRLCAAKGAIIKSGARVCCVCEDWPGGAGNGLGSLYAYQKARQKILYQDNIDINNTLLQGGSIAIYHTAGIGKRLFPLTASEYGNKASVKLPSLIDKGHFLTILEAVIKQTGVFSAVRKGRVSVFWGDQVFIPSVPIQTRSKAHIDILALVGKLPSEEAWAEKEMSNYGLIAIDQNGEAKDVEKCEYSTVHRLSATKKVSFEGGAGASLGCFSLSSEMLFALLDEFSSELTGKNAKMDSDPYMWMPLTLDEETYLEAMCGKEGHKQELSEHYRRMQAFKLRFSRQHEGRLFGVVDVGNQAYWWDYGTLHSYVENNLKICDESPESVAMKAFFQLGGPIAHSHIRLNRSFRSVVVGVSADQLRISNSVLINTDIIGFEGDHCFLYNVVENTPQHYTKDTVRADVFIPAAAAHLKMLTSMERDGKTDWSLQLPGNPCSYEELYRLIQSVDPIVAERYTAPLHKGLVFKNIC